MVAFCPVFSIVQHILLAWMGLVGVCGGWGGRFVASRPVDVDTDVDVDVDVDTGVDSIHVWGAFVDGLLVTRRAAHGR